MHQQASRGGFATAGLADNAQCFAFHDVEADVIDGLHVRVDVAQRSAQRKVFAQPGDRDHRLKRATPIALVHARTSMAVRRLSLSRLKLTEAARIITPGRTAFTGAT